LAWEINNRMKNRSIVEPPLTAMEKLAATLL
jgi:hypothetical protein